MSFPRYPAYKPSGVEWLGEVPEHWNALPLRRLISEMSSGTSVNAIDEPASPGQPGVLKTSCVYTGEFRPEENKAILESELERATCPVIAGSLIVSRMNTPELVGAAGLVKYDDLFLFLPDRLWQVTFQDCNPQFMNYWCKSVSYRSQVQLACSGTSSSMQNLSQDNFYSFIAPLPSKTEQLVISSFLDRETAKIDALITEQQRLIELLQEKRQAVISHAVTKGLNPNAPMKDSGVEWLGEVQEHWEVKRLKDISSVIDCRNKTPDYVENGEYLVVRTTNIKGRSLVLEDAKYTDELNFKIWTQRGVPRAGSIFFTREAPAGETALVPEGVPLCMGQRMMNIDTSSQALTGYILCFLQSSCLKRYIEACSMGSIVGHLRVPQVENLPLPVPPAGEQEQIARRVAKLDDTFDEVTSNLTTSINLLKERRSALISAAVTGQIDVRGLVEAEGSEK